MLLGMTCHAHIAARGPNIAAHARHFGFSVHTCSLLWPVLASVLGWVFWFSLNLALGVCAGVCAVGAGAASGPTLGSELGSELHVCSVALSSWTAPEPMHCQRPPLQLPHLAHNTACHAECHAAAAAACAGRVVQPPLQLPACNDGGLPGCDGPQQHQLLLRHSAPVPRQLLGPGVCCTHDGLPPRPPRSGGSPPGSTCPFLHLLAKAKKGAFSALCSQMFLSQLWFVQSMTDSPCLTYLMREPLSSFFWSMNNTSVELVASLCLCC